MCQVLLQARKYMVQLGDQPKPWWRYFEEYTGTTVGKVVYCSVRRKLLAMTAKIPPKTEGVVAACCIQPALQY